MHFSRASLHSEREVSAQLPKLIQLNLQHKEPEALPVTVTAMLPLENLVLKNTIVPKEATSPLWTNLQSTKHM